MALIRAGDLMLGRGVNAMLRREGVDYALGALAVNHGNAEWRVLRRAVTAVFVGW